MVSAREKTTKPRFIPARGPGRKGVGEFCHYEGACVPARRVVGAATPMAEATGSGSKRSRHIEEVVLQIEGVVGVRVWEMPGQVAIGVAISPNDTVVEV